MFGVHGRGILAASLAGMLLVSCKSGSGGTASTNVESAAVTQQMTAAQKLALEIDVSRLAKQATFGATPGLIDHMKAVGVSAWLDEQFVATGSSYDDITDDKVLWSSCPSQDTQCQRHYFSREPVAMRFYQNAVGQPDQLRQRVALALSQLMVASTEKLGHASGLAGYNQILLDNAFANFRTILGAVTLSGYMGNYLDMQASQKNAPNENYAREMMQLFTMGPNRLNMDGTLVRDSSGSPIANYTADDVKAVARALTGWQYAHFNGGTDYASIDYAAPMLPTGYYDNTAKTLLGITIPAGATPADSVKLVLDAAFNSASTPPYIARFLIQQLVTSNPTPAYVGRVAAVFANNGANVRGDMRAVIRAILTDAEARGAAGTTDNYGKVKEPILLLTGLARAVGMATDGWVFYQRDTGLGQAVFQAPSVFNFYPPDFPLSQSSTLVSPASKTLTTASIIARSNVLYDWTYGAVTTRTDFGPATKTTGATGSAFDWSAWEAFGTDIDGMIDRVDLLLANRSLTGPQKAALKTAATAVTNANATTQARMRAQALLYIVASSPLYQVDR